jgi:hypothetical protein
MGPGPGRSCPVLPRPAILSTPTQQPTPEHLWSPGRVTKIAGRYDVDRPAIVLTEWRDEDSRNGRDRDGANRDGPGQADWAAMIPSWLSWPNYSPGKGLTGKNKGCLEKGKCHVLQI